jgi:hypothetical protein
MLSLFFGDLTILDSFKSDFSISITLLKHRELASVKPKG